MKRPDGVTLIALFHFAATLFWLLIACMVTAVPFFVMSIAEAEVKEIVPLVFLAAILGGGLMVLVGAANAVVGWGLWEMKPWARMAAIVLAAIAGITIIPVGTVIGGLIVWYLFQPEAREAFGETV